MQTNIINGREVAAALQQEVAREVEAIRVRDGSAPKLAVSLVGEDPASQIYVRNKSRMCGKLGILQDTILLPDTATTGQVMQKVEELNRDKSVNGILVQLPLPGQIDENKVTQSIDPLKDVDGFHIANAGKLLMGIDGEFVSCTAEGIMELIRRTGYDLDGAVCAVIGRSSTVGRPVSMMLQRQNATVIMCHSHTRNLKELLRQADVVVSAVGKPDLIDGSMIKEGALIIDAGISRVGGHLAGDVDMQSCMGRAGYITPVPGGVGPMTIIMLMKNCLKAYYLQQQMQAGQ